MKDSLVANLTESLDELLTTLLCCRHLIVYGESLIAVRPAAATIHPLLSPTSLLLKSCLAPHWREY